MSYSSMARSTESNVESIEETTKSLESIERYKNSFSARIRKWPMLRIVDHKQYCFSQRL